LGAFGSAESWREYNRLLAEWTAARAGEPLPAAPAGKLTVAVLVVLFLHAAEKDRTDPEFREYRITCETLVQLYGDRPAVEFGPIALRAVRQAWVDAGCCRRTCNQRAGRVKTMLKWAVAEELVPASVHEALLRVPGLQAGRTSAPDRPKVLPVSPEVVERTLPWLSPVLQAMVRVQQYTGMRPGEVCIMRPTDLDRSSLAIDGVPIWVFRPSMHKGLWRGKSKAVVIGPKAQAVLLPFLDRAPDAYLFTPAESRGGVRPPGSKRAPGARWMNYAYANAIHWAIDRANRHGEEIPHWTPHQVRHQVATEVRAQYGLEASRNVLGHSDPGITLLYAERDLQAAAAIVAKLG
jgi:integrase